MWLLRPIYGLRVRFQYPITVFAVISSDRVFPRDQRHIKASPVPKEAGSLGGVGLAHG
jgi:hypothetical protein